MLRSIKEIEGYRIHATDGEIGKVHDFYFDDFSWNIRYLVADTGSWIKSRLVLISPEALGTPSWEEQYFPVNLTMEKIKNSPPIETDENISKQMETHLSDYYGWPYYWTGLAARIPSLIPLQPEAFLETERQLKKDTEEFHTPPEHNLRSTRAIVDYKIHANDGDIGNVEDFIVEDGTWSIRYIVVDTGNWLLPGKKVLVALPWIKSIDWKGSKMYVDLSKEELKESPEYDPTRVINREFEKNLHNHYGKPNYWKE
ncbi:MAG: PRC-barrel domain-containing protein [Bacillota bacterium]